MSNAINPYLDLAYGVLDDGEIDLSGDDVPAVPADVGAVQHGNAYPPQVRAYAFRLWTYDAQRNPRRVVELLHERADIEVSEATIRRWVVLDDWESRAVGYHQSSAFALRQATQASIDIGATKAIKALTDILDDVTASPGSRVKAAGLVLGMAGFVAVRGSETSINLALNSGRSALAEATDEELERIAEAYGTDNADVEPPIEINEYEARLSGQDSYRHHHKR